MNVPKRGRSGAMRRRAVGEGVDRRESGGGPVVDAGQQSGGEEKQRGGGVQLHPERAGLLDSAKCRGCGLALLGRRRAVRKMGGHAGNGHVDVVENDETKKERRGIALILILRRRVTFVIIIIIIIITSVVVG